MDKEKRGKMEESSRKDEKERRGYTGTSAQQVGNVNHVQNGERDPVRCRVTASMNNTKVVRTWYDQEKGKRINRVKTAGSRGYKNAKRGTVYAAQERGAYVVKTYGKEREGKGIHLHRRGMGVGRAVRLTELEKGGRKIITVSDATKDAHNGCRRKKQRRI